MKNNMTLDLPIEEMKEYVNSILDQIGEEVTVNINGKTLKIMIADLAKVYNNLDQNTKRVVLPHQSKIKRGDRIEFQDGRVGIVYTVPDDAVVSDYFEMVMCNAKIDVYFRGVEYDADPDSLTFGDVIKEGDILRGQYEGFIERIGHRERNEDAGIFQDSILRFVTFYYPEISVEDIFYYRGKKYRVIDIDNITEGTLIIQLANLRAPVNKT